MWAKRACSRDQREMIPTHFKLRSYLLQMTEELVIGSDRLGALWVELKTLCGFKPCLVSVSVESGNDTEDVFPVGLVAGVPWIGEWHGEVRGEIFGGIPGKRKEKSCQLTEVADGCRSSLCRNTPLEMCRYQYSFQTGKSEKTLLHSEPSPQLSQRDEAPLISATSTRWRSGSKHEAYSPSWAGCTNWQAWNERNALVAWLLVSTLSSDRDTRLQIRSFQTHLQFLFASLSPSVKQGQERFTHISSKFEFLDVRRLAINQNSNF